MHSLKDLETELPAGIVLACTLKREDARDVLILGPGRGEPDAATRMRRCRRRPDRHQFGPAPGAAAARAAGPAIGLIRGNVQTRLDRCRAAIAGHPAGAGRTAPAGPRDEAPVVLDPDAMVPSACQGIVGVTVRADDTELRAMLAGIEDPVAQAVATAERALLAALDGSCRTPIGGHARLLPDGRLHLTGLVARADGSFLLKRSLHGAREDAARIGADLGASLRADSPRDIFA